MRRMPLTPSERRALLWLLSVLMGGSTVHVFRQWRYSDTITPQSGEALRRQLLAVDSAQRSERQGSARRAGGSGRRRKQRSDAPLLADVAATQSTRASEPRAPTPVDVDRADSAALEGLPRIGPALAARIVNDRASKGPYGSIGALERVRGIGPKMAAALAPLVTFSGTPRPSPVQR